MIDLIIEYYNALNYYGYSMEEAEELLNLIWIKYGNLSDEELSEVFRSAMTSCREESSLSLEERLSHIDGLWFVYRKYADYGSLIKSFPLDNLSKVMINVFEKEQGDFLTEEEMEFARFGILTGCLLISENNSKTKKRL